MATDVADQRSLGDWLTELVPCFLTICPHQECQALACWQWQQCGPTWIRWPLGAVSIPWRHSSLRTLDSTYSFVSLIHLQFWNPRILSLQCASTWAAISSACEQAATFTLCDLSPRAVTLLKALGTAGWLTWFPLHGDRSRKACLGSPRMTWFKAGQPFNRERHVPAEKSWFSVGKSHKGNDSTALWRNESLPKHLLFFSISKEMHLQSRHIPIIWANLTSLISRWVSKGKNEYQNVMSLLIFPSSKWIVCHPDESLCHIALPNGTDQSP